MSMLTLIKGATPSAPVANKTRAYIDTADNKLKTIDEFGNISVVAPDGWRDRPLISNAMFEYAQRQVPLTLTTYSTVGGRLYGPDGWFISNENASVQFAQVDTMGAIESGLGSRYYGKFLKLTSAGKMFVGQVLAAKDMAHMRGNLCRIQCNMRYGVNPMTTRLGLIQLTAAGTVDTYPSAAAGFISAWGAAGTDPTLTAAANLAYLTPLTAEGTIAGNAISCVLNATWTRCSGTFLVPADCKGLILAIWTNGQPAANDTFLASEMGVYEGTEIRTNFTPYDSIFEYVRAMQYYQKSFNQLIAPAQSAGLIGALNGIASLAGATALAGRIWWNLAVPLRTTPVSANIVLFNPSAGNALMRHPYVGTPIDMGATAVTANLSNSQIEIAATGAATTLVGSVCAIHATVDVSL